MRRVLTLTQQLAQLLMGFLGIGGYGVMRRPDVGLWGSRGQAPLCIYRPHSSQDPGEVPAIANFGSLPTYLGSPAN